MFLSIAEKAGPVILLYIKIPYILTNIYLLECNRNMFMPWGYG